MKEPAVVIPFKASGAKSRLSRMATEQQREAIALAMLKSVLGVLGTARLIGSSYVVSADTRALSLASKAGATPVPESADKGVNEAVAVGMRAAAGFKNILVLPSDLPLVSRAELRSLVDLKDNGVDVVIAPSRAFDGTNALLFTRSDGLPLRYDTDSFWGHLEGAGKLGLSAAVSTSKGLAFDVDSPGDLRSLAKSSSDGQPSRLARRFAR